MSSLFKVFFILSFLSLNAYSLERGVSQVIKLKGKATKLLPGQHRAEPVKMGDLLDEDTSVLTEEKSFIQLKNKDGSLISLGPQSKLVVAKLNKEGNGILKLLKGKLRTKVVPSTSGEKKLYLKTRTASVGVRGTEFETLYIPENNVTTLLTYEGEVAMKRSNNKDIYKGERVTERDLDKMEDQLSNESVTVRRGQFSQTVGALKTTSQPVVINPVQLNALYKNSEFVKKDEFKIDKADVKSAEDLSIVPVRQEVPAEGIKREGYYAPKSGGFIDRETGLYVPPTEDAVYDNKLGVYVDEEVGSIDSETGQYEAPVGLKLDPLKGFVKRKLKEDAPVDFKEKVAKLEQKLNRQLDAGVVVGDLDEGDIQNSWDPLSQRELYSKNAVEVSLRSFSQDITIDRDTVVGGGRTFSSQSGTELTIQGFFKANKLFQPFVLYKRRSYELNSLGSFRQESQKFSDLGVGFQYSLSSRWNLTSQLLLEQSLFLHHTSGTSATQNTFIRVTLPKVMVGVQGSLARSGRFALDTHLNLGTNFSKSTGSQEVEGFGLNFGLGLGARYWLSQSWALGADYRFAYGSYDSSGSSVSYQASTEFEQSSLGLKVFTYF